MHAAARHCHLNVRHRQLPASSGSIACAAARACNMLLLTSTHPVPLTCSVLTSPRPPPPRPRYHSMTQSYLVEVRQLAASGQLRQVLHAARQPQLQPCMALAACRCSSAPQASSPAATSATCQYGPTQVVDQEGHQWDDQQPCSSRQGRGDSGTCCWQHTAAPAAAAEGPQHAFDDLGYCEPGSMVLQPSDLSSLGPAASIAASIAAGQHAPASSAALRSCDTGACPAGCGQQADISTQRWLPAGISCSAATCSSTSSTSTVIDHSSSLPISCSSCISADVQQQLPQRGLDSLHATAAQQAAAGGRSAFTADSTACRQPGQGCTGPVSGMAQPAGCSRPATAAGIAGPAAGKVAAGCKLAAVAGLGAGPGSAAAMMGPGSGRGAPAAGGVARRLPPTVPAVARSFARLACGMVLKHG
jgi:hypothetical protein